LCKRFEDILKTLNPNINTQIIEDDIINNISTLEYFIGMRFHSLLVALKAGVKTCAIDYDIKVDTLAKEAGLPVVSMDASENFEEIYNKLINLDTKKLLEYGNSKQFDWTLLDKFLLT
jgi:polysaccharide pyruvyl transferase WcaK-like protein